MKRTKVRAILIGCLLFIGLHFPAFHKAQNTASPVGDKQVYEFLNWFISLNQVYNCKVAAPALKWNEPELKLIPDLPDGTFSSTNPYVFRGIEKQLGEEVIGYMYAQHKANQKRNWSQDMISRAKLLSEAESHILLNRKDKKLWNQFKREQGAYLLLYSVPLFSPDQNYVLMKFEKRCGVGCAEGCTFLYRRIPGRTWELYSNIKCFSIKE